MGAVCACVLLSNNKLIHSLHRERNWLREAERLVCGHRVSGQQSSDWNRGLLPANFVITSYYPIWSAGERRPKLGGWRGRVWRMRSSQNWGRRRDSFRVGRQGTDGCEHPQGTAGSQKGSCRWAEVPQSRTQPRPGIPSFRHSPPLLRLPICVEEHQLPLPVMSHCRPG